MKIAITGGHLTPALAVIQELKRRLKNEAEVVYFGRKYNFEGKDFLANEYLEIPKTGAKYRILQTGRLQRIWTKHTIPSLIRIPYGFIQAYVYLRQEKPGAILSFGGYVSLPVVICGWLLGIPVVIHEQTASVGLANKIGGRFAKRICVTWPETIKLFAQHKTVVTGNPIRKEIFDKFVANTQELNNNKLADFMKRIGKTEQVIFITGGNQGSQTINCAVVQILDDLLNKYVMIHHTGQLDFENINQRAELISEKLKTKYFLQPWFSSSEYGWILNRADLVISRAGANTVYELAVLNKKSILIPIPWASQNEQVKNAQLLKNYCQSETIGQTDLTPEKLISTVNHMMKNQNLSEENTQTVILNAAEKIVDILINVSTENKKGS